MGVFQILLLITLLAHVNGLPQFNNHEGSMVGQQVGADGAVFNNDNGAIIGSIEMGTKPTAAEAAVTGSIEMTKNPTAFEKEEIIANPSGVTSESVAETQTEEGTKNCKNTEETTPIKTIVNPAPGLNSYQIIQRHPDGTMLLKNNLGMIMTMGPNVIGMNVAGQNGMLMNVANPNGLHMNMANGMQMNMPNGNGMQMNMPNGMQMNVPNGVQMNLANPNEMQMAMANSNGMQMAMANPNGMQMNMNGLSGSPVLTMQTSDGQIINVGKQMGVQMMSRKKRSPQGTFGNWGSQIGQQIDSSTKFNFGPMPAINWHPGMGMGMPPMGGGGQFNNFNSQIGQQVAGRKKRSAQFNNVGSQIGQQFGGGYGSFAIPRFHGGFGGGSTFNNWGSQVGQQFGRKKRSASQFNNVGSQIGQQFGGGFGGFGRFGGFGGGQFNNWGSQIGQQFGR